MDALELDKATLVGNSMGGGTTLRFGYEHPERVHRLITMGSSSGAPTINGPAGLTEGLKLLQKGYRQPSSGGCGAGFHAPHAEHGASSDLRPVPSLLFGGRLQPGPLAPTALTRLVSHDSRDESGP